MGAARPDRQREPRRQVGQLGHVPRARARRADDVRPDDRRLVDLHRHPGHPAGHVRDVRRAGAAALRRHAARPGRAHCRSGRHGRRAAAGGDDERWRRAGDRGRRAERARRRLEHGLSSIECRTRSTRRWPGRARRPRDGRPESIASIGNAAEVEPELVRRGEQIRRADRPDLRPRRAQRLHPAGLDFRRRGRTCASRDPDEYIQAVDGIDGRRRCGRCSRCKDVGRRDVRLRQQHPRPGAGGRRRRTRSTSRASCRRSSGRCSPKERGRSDGSRCRAIRPTSGAPTTPCSSSSPRTSRCARWIRMAQERVPFQGLPARICWLGYGERARAGLRFNELVASGEVSAPIVIGRDHLDSRLGRLAQPRDGRDARRLGRDRRLAAAQRARQHGGRRVVGVDPPRRRHGHRLLAARRHGRRRRRDRRSRRRSWNAS